MWLDSDVKPLDIMWIVFASIENFEGLLWGMEIYINWHLSMIGEITRPRKWGMCICGDQKYDSWQLELSKVHALIQYIMILVSYNLTERKSMKVQSLNLEYNNLNIMIQIL